MIDTAGARIHRTGSRLPITPSNLALLALSPSRVPPRNAPSIGNRDHVISKFCGPSLFEPSKVVSVAFVDPKWTCFDRIEDSSILTSESLRNTFTASLVAAFTSSVASTSIAKTGMIHD